MDLKIIEYKHAPCCGHICGLTNGAGDAMKRQRSAHGNALRPLMLQRAFPRIRSLLLSQTVQPSEPPSQDLAIVALKAGEGGGAAKRQSCGPHPQHLPQASLKQLSHNQRGEILNGLKEEALL